MLVVRLPARGWRMVRPIVTVLTAWQRSCPRPFDSPSIVRLIEGQKNGTMFEMVYTSDEPIDFFLAENRWQGLGSLAVRHGLDDPRSRQGDRVEEP